MNQPLFSPKQIIFAVIVVGMSVVPLYGQQNSESVIFKAATQSHHDGPCFDEKDVRAYVVLHRRSPVHPQSGVRVDLSKVGRLEFIDARETHLFEVYTPGPFNATRTQTNSLRYRAGETPAVPVKSLTPAPGADANHSTDASHSADANQGNQTTSNPYVFPTRKERFDRYVKSMFGPSALIRSAISAGINQWKDSPEEWEQGMSGYGKRLASTFGRRAIQQTVIYGLDSALGWDTGFRRSPSKEFGARLKHALLENITSRTKSGKRVISVPRIAGAYTSGVISREAWYPERYTWKDGLRSGTNSLMMGFIYNLVREFVVKF